MTPTKKNIGIGAIVAAVLGSGGYVVVAEPVYAILDTRYVTIASQNLEIMFDIEDELAKIQRRVDEGTETVDDLVRRGVLEERLKRLELK